MIDVKSTAFEPGQPIPEKYSQEGANVSPPLSWEGAPDETEEFAVVVDDPDAPGAGAWVHWLVWGIPAETDSLAEGDGPAFTRGKNSGGGTGYTGPMPPPGHGIHHYHFKIYALDAPVKLDEGAEKDDLIRAMEGHIIDRGELIGTYERT